MLKIGKTGKQPPLNWDSKETANGVEFEIAGRNIDQVTEC